MARIISDPLSFKESDIIPQGLCIRYVGKEGVHQIAGYRRRMAGEAVFEFRWPRRRYQRRTCRTIRVSRNHAEQICLGIIPIPLAVGRMTKLAVEVVYSDLLERERSIVWQVM